MKICGIDEAGRGPVVGPLVIAAVMVEDGELQDMGLKDSKLLSKQRREELFALLQDVEHTIIEVEPSEIDKAVAQNNLNWLEAAKSIELIKRLEPEKVYLDCPSRNVDTYQAHVAQQVECEVIAEHKADMNYPVVSAASILAKVVRDRRIAALQKELGVPVGSGYPADPTTQQFLKQHYKKHAAVFRKSWSSYQTIVRENEQQSIRKY